MPGPASIIRPDWENLSQSEFRSRYQDLNSLRDLAIFLGLDPYQISYYAFHLNKQRAYKEFEIPRRNGGKRKIEQPVRTLKYIQRIIHESMMKIYGPHPAVHGFVAGRSIVTNAEQHLARKYILNVDLVDFFPSITRKRIYGRLTSAPYLLNSKVANMIASLTTNSVSSLPQGSPSSPVLANMVAAEMDSELAKLCSAFRCRYTRYADDMTISTSRGEMPRQLARYPKAQGTGQAIIGDALTDIIEKHGFQINHRKTRLQSYWTRQLCTGLVVNGNRPSPPRSYIRRLRSLIDHWEKNGWQDAAQVVSQRENRQLFNTRNELANHVIGRINYLRMVRGQDDSTAQRLSDIVSALPVNH